MKYCLPLSEHTISGTHVEYSTDTRIWLTAVIWHKIVWHLSLVGCHYELLPVAVVCYRTGTMQ